ncbi:MAG: xanthine dehydrogenase family protein molybdopterin-binding subunit, partial [Caldilineaceae bacterium]
NALLAALGPYRIPNVRLVARTVYTNNTPSGAFRGFGGPQGHFAAEMQMNKLAEALGLDPVEFRMRNLWRDGDMLATRSPLPAGVTAVEVVEAAARAGGWLPAAGAGWLRAGAVDAAPPVRALTSFEAASTTADNRVVHGRGFACCFKNVGFSLGAPEQCNAWVEIHGSATIARAVVGCVGADVGQGAHSAFRQIAAEVLGIDPALVELRADSSDVTGSSGSASASRLTFMAGNAIAGAAQRALAAWNEEERPARADFTFRPRPTSRYDKQTGAADPNITYGYCAQVADVAVDLDTGHVTLKRLVSVNDVGRAVNPQQVEGQIEGAVAQSAGWALLENYVQHAGRAQSTRLSTYLIPSVLDVAESLEPIILELPDPQGPLGIRGMAE